MNYQKEIALLQNKLKASNQRNNNLKQMIEDSLEVKDQNSSLQNQLKFIKGLLHLKYKEIKDKEQHLVSAENALMQKDSTIQELQGMLRKFIARYGQISPKDKEQQQLDQPCQNYIANTRIDKLEQRVSGLQQAMEFVNVLKPSEFEIFWKVTKERGND